MTVCEPSKKLFRYLRIFLFSMGVLNLRHKHFPDSVEARSSFTNLNKVASYTKIGPPTISLKAADSCPVFLKTVWQPQKQQVGKLVTSAAVLQTM